MKKLTTYSLLTILLFSSGCQLLDRGFRNRLHRLIEINNDIKYGIKDYYNPPRDYEEELKEIYGKLNSHSKL